MTLPTEREPRPAKRRPRDYVVCSADEIAAGEHRIVRVRGHSIGIFNVEGRFCALHNRCPHRGAPLCEGRVCGTTVDTGDYTFAYGREGEIIRCVWQARGLRSPLGARWATRASRRGRTRSQSGRAGSSCTSDVTDQARA